MLVIFGPLSPKLGVGSRHKFEWPGSQQRRRWISTLSNASADQETPVHILCSKPYISTLRSPAREDTPQYPRATIFNIRKWSHVWTPKSPLYVNLANKLAKVDSIPDHMIVALPTSVFTCNMPPEMRWAWKKRWGSTRQYSTRHSMACRQKKHYTANQNHNFPAIVEPKPRPCPQDCTLQTPRKEEKSDIQAYITCQTNETEENNCRHEVQVSDI